ncbi:MAG: hypothetical protein ACKEQK_00565, partial [Candidatus Hodgkinia cicadicola]
MSICKTITTLAKGVNRNPFPRGKLIGSKVNIKTSGYAVVDITQGCQAVLLNNGSWSYQNLSVGDSLDVYVEGFSEEEGVIFVSRRDLDREELWGKLTQLCKNREEVEGEIIGLARRGLKMVVYGLFGVVYWTEDLIKLENELRKRIVLMVHVRALCREHNMIVLSPSREIEDRDQRRPKSLVWVMLVDLCDIGVLTVVDGCNGIIILNGKPWCNALGFLNRLQFGKLCLGTFAKLGRGVKVEQTEDCVDLVVNFVLEAEGGLKWDRNVIGIGVTLVLGWVLSLALEERERWWDWREGGSCFGSTEAKRDTVGEEALASWGWRIKQIDETQNMFWKLERVYLEDASCGFEWRRFALTQHVLEMVKEGQLNKEDKIWLEKVKHAWLSEGVSIESKCNRWYRSGKRDRVFNTSRYMKRGVVLEDELDWGDKRDLEDEMKVIKFAGIAKDVGSEEMERKGGEVKHNELLSDIGISNQGEERAVKLSLEMEERLDDEWDDEWYLEREVEYWRNQYRETKGSLIETNVGGWRTIKTLRMVYGVIVGMDVNLGMLVVAVCDTLAAYVCDFSLTDEDVMLLEGDWKNDLALKVIPVGLS